MNVLFRNLVFEAVWAESPLAGGKISKIPRFGNFYRCGRGTNSIFRVGSVHNMIDYIDTSILS